jgi:hypothetical protein
LIERKSQCLLWNPLVAGQIDWLLGKFTAKQREVMAVGQSRRRYDESVVTIEVID